jgi:hypothetical protein
MLSILGPEWDARKKYANLTALFHGRGYVALSERGRLLIIMSGYESVRVPFQVFA